MILLSPNSSRSQLVVLIYVHNVNVVCLVMTQLVTPPRSNDTCFGDVEVAGSCLMAECKGRGETGSAFTLAREDTDEDAVLGCLGPEEDTDSLS